MTTTIYMGGRLTGRTKAEILAEHKPIRKAIMAKGWKYIDPFEKEEALFQAHEQCGFETQKLPMREIISIDKQYIRESNIYLYLTGDIPSYGSLLEFGYARYQLVMPMVVIAPKHASGEIKNWLNVEADALVDTYNDALDVIAIKWASNAQRILWRHIILRLHGRSAEIVV